MDRFGWEVDTLEVRLVAYALFICVVAVNFVLTWLFSLIALKREITTGQRNLASLTIAAYATVITAFTFDIRFPLIIFLLVPWVSVRAMLSGYFRPWSPLFIVLVVLIIDCAALLAMYLLISPFI